MSQVDALLNSLDYTVIPADVYHTYVDGGWNGNDIEIADAYRKLHEGVTNVHFTCPSIFDPEAGNLLIGTDWLYRAVVEYHLSDGTSGTYECDDIYIDGGDENLIHFDWIIDSNIFLAPGVLSFTVRFDEYWPDDEYADIQQQHYTNTNSQLYIEDVAPDPIDAEPHIVIGEDRFITVPDELKRIAVQFDHNVETVTFDCPRYYDGLDLSRMVIYINYILANGAFGYYIADNHKVEDDIFHFDWTISRNVTHTKGAITFLVCAKRVDEEGYEINYWNSELNKEMYVSEGLAWEEELVNQYPQLVQELLLRMGAVEEMATPEAIQEAIDTFILENPHVALDKISEIITSDTIKEYVDAYLNEHPIDVDNTLSVEGMAADAAAVGAELQGLSDHINEVSDLVNMQDSSISELSTTVESHQGDIEELWKLKTISVNKLSDAGWVKGATSLSYAPYAVAYGNGMFTLIKYLTGSTCSSYHSTDGVTWTAGGTIAATNAPHTMAYGNGIWVAAGPYGNVWYSTDNTATWTAATSLDISTRSQFVTYAEGKFVIVCHCVNGSTSQFYAYCSTDGVTWTKHSIGSKNSSSTTYSIYGVAYGNGRFVTVTRGGYTYYSADGETWTAGETLSELDTNIVTGFESKHGRFVITDGSKSYTSSDGSTWSDPASIDIGSVFGFAYSNGYFIALTGSTSTTNMYVSTNGISWSQMNAPDTSLDVIVAGDDKFVVFDTYAYSLDMVTHEAPIESVLENLYRSYLLQNNL